MKSLENLKREIEEVRKILKESSEGSDEESLSILIEYVAFRRLCLEHGFTQTEAYEMLTEKEAEFYDKVVSDNYDEYLEERVWEKRA